MAITPLRFTPATTGLGAGWLSACQSTKSGPIANLYNVLLALRNDPHWSGKFRFDEMLWTVVMPEKPIEDTDVFRVHEWMQEHGLKRLGLDPVREAIEIVGREHKFHPLRDWLDALEWDEELRITNWLIDYLGANDDDYTTAVGPWFLTGMVARVYQPGCKADYMLVLEGPQGIMKSQACAALAGQYFSDSLPDLSSDAVRVAMHLRGKWLIEVSELSSFGRAEAAHLKAFLSSQIEQYTPKFARREVREPRQCLFVGTTNDNAYLRDPTGGRRFWPVPCNDIKVDAIIRDREQLFAEAVVNYKRGGQWWPEPGFQNEHIAPVQDDRYEADAWEPKIRTYLDSKIAAVSSKYDAKTTLHDVAVEALFFSTSNLKTADQRRIAAVLRHAGWDAKKGTGGARIWAPV